MTSSDSRVDGLEASGHARVVLAGYRWIKRFTTGGVSGSTGGDAIIRAFPPGAERTAAAEAEAT